LIDRVNELHENGAEEVALAVEHPGQGPVVPLVEALLPGVGEAGRARGLLDRPQQARSQHRLEDHGAEDRHQQRAGHRERLVAEELAGDAGHVDDGEEDGHGGQRGGDDGHRHFLGALDRERVHLGLTHGRSPFGQAPADVLEHHDRVVHQHARRQREPAE
jgi:hypothetical protein